MSFETFEEIMNYAIGKEREAVAFYEEISNHEKFSGLERHLNLLQKKNRSMWIC